jgi:hypothetical protein
MEFHKDRIPREPTTRVFKNRMAEATKKAVRADKPKAEAELPCKVKVVGEAKTFSRGVFATHQINRYEVACFFDSQRVDPKKMLTPLQRRFQFGYDRVGQIVPRHPRGVAQLINDPARPQWLDLPMGGTDTERVKRVLQVLPAYFEANVLKENVVVIPDIFGGGEHPVARAICDIKPGEELLWSYGIKYWRLHDAWDVSDTLLKAITQAIWCLEQLWVVGGEEIIAEANAKAKKNDEQFRVKLMIAMQLQAATTLVDELMPQLPVYPEITEELKASGCRLATANFPCKWKYPSPATN